MDYPREITLRFSAKGSKTKKTFEGDFTFRTVLNNAEMMLVAINADRYSGNSRSVDPAYREFARSVAELEARIVVREGERGAQKLLAPEWFRESDYGRKLIDPNLVFELESWMSREGDQAFTKALDAELAAAEAAANIKPPEEKKKA